MNVLVLIGHPRPGSLCEALAHEYAQGARAAGMTTRVLQLARLDFDPDVRPVSPAAQTWEPDLAAAAGDFAWAEHVAIVLPAWWGMGPAKLKAFFDRLFVPGWAFVEQAPGRYRGLLDGRSAHLILTLDMPAFVYRLFYRSPGVQGLRRSTLGFCGIRTTRVVLLGPVRTSSPQQRRTWLQECRRLGQSLAEGPRTRLARRVHAVATWLQALRLQFYPMTWMAYSAGALLAVHGERRIDTRLYWLGYACAFAGEALTVFVNDWFDFSSDERNRHAGPFTGGSRVLVDRLLTRRQFAAGIRVALFAALAFGAATVLLSTQGALVALAFAALLLMGIGYTAPPLKLSWRGLGEADVGVSHSFGIVLFGFLVQGGSWSDPRPWLLAAPLCVSVWPAILLSGIPDYAADAAAGKRTLAVVFGVQRSLWLAAALACAAALLALWVNRLPATAFLYGAELLGAAAHALALAVVLLRKQPDPAGERIDPIMAGALTFILWFVVPPLLRLATGT